MKVVSDYTCVLMLAVKQISSIWSEAREVPAQGVTGGTTSSSKINNKPSSTTRSGHYLNSILMAFSRMSVKILFKNTKSPFASVVFDCVLGPLRLAAHSYPTFVLISRLVKIL